MRTVQAGDSGRCIQQFKHPFRRGDGPLQNIELIGKVADGPEEHLRVLDKSHQRAVGGKTFRLEHAAAHQYDGQGDGTDKFYGRVKNGIIGNGFHISLGVLAVYNLKILVIFFLAVKYLHNIHAGDVFL